MNLENFLVVGAVLFGVGLYGTLSKRNVITVLMGLELMFNAVNITAVALSRYIVPSVLIGDVSVRSDEILRLLLTGQIFAIFIVAVAAAEVAVGIAIVISMYRYRETVFITDVSEMRH